MECQPQLRSAKTVKIICKPTRVQAGWKAWTALELNRSMPTEHTIQLPTPIMCSKCPAAFLTGCTLAASG